MSNINRPDTEYSAIYVARDDGDYDLLQVLTARMRESYPQILKRLESDPDIMVVHSDVNDFPDVWESTAEPVTEAQVAQAVENAMPPDPLLYEVLTKNADGEWVNSWVQTFQGVSTPMKFHTIRAAELEIEAHIRDCEYAFAEGQLEEVPTRRDFRLVQVGATEETLIVGMTLTRAVDPFNMSEGELSDEITSWLSDLGFTVNINHIVLNQR